MRDSEKKQTHRGDGDAAAKLARELAEERALERHERSQLIRIGRAIRLADFMAILMVLATGFSAYATWRTAQVTRMVFAVSDRPFVGVASVKFEETQSASPRIAVNFSNFGKIPALDALVSVHSIVDGKPAKNTDGEMTTMDAGILSPGVPHYFYNYFTPEVYQAVVSGKSKLQVHIHILYKGPAQARQFCYFERVFYDQHSGSFRAGGGSDHCAGNEVY
ncbi:MAG TPA: hypothetical protein VMV27_03650 [Candidatus Binataceae bacterium]|nr:hypothetical protein [Candidatus Binataceae bacterium]